MTLYKCTACSGSPQLLHAYAVLSVHMLEARVDQLKYRHTGCQAAGWQAGLAKHQAAVQSAPTSVGAVAHRRQVQSCTGRGTRASLCRFVLIKPAARAHIWRLETTLLQYFRHVTNKWMAPCNTYNVGLSYYRGMWVQWLCVRNATCTTYCYTIQATQWLASNVPSALSPTCVVGSLQKRNSQ